MKESRTLEFKREVSRSFLKTVSAYANFGTGKIIFGVADEGIAVGLADTDAAYLAIENAINDSIDPRPRYVLETARRSEKDIVVLTVFEGPDKPYYFRGKAYTRNDTADVVVDRTELNRLILAGQNLSFEEAPAATQNLSFDILSDKLHERAGVSSANIDVLRTLNLYSSKNGYNNAAAVLADTNDFPGIDIVRFGASVNEIRDRRQLIGMSAIKQLDEAIATYRTYYQYEKIEGALRKTFEQIPEEAFREAVANALVHRLWDVSSNIQISMDNEGIAVTSPGGLPRGLTEKEYLDNRISNLRNPIIGNVFFRLDYIEMFGTGIERIKAAYEPFTAKPAFTVSKNYLTVSLPVVDAPTKPLTADERKVFDAFATNHLMSRSDLEQRVGLSPATTGRILRALVEHGLLTRIGAGRSTKYERTGDLRN